MAKNRAATRKPARRPARLPRSIPGTIGGPDPAVREEPVPERETGDPSLTVETDRGKAKRRVLGKIKDEHWVTLRPYIARQANMQRQVDQMITALGSATDTLKAMLYLATGDKKVKLDANTRELYIEEEPAKEAETAE